MVAISSVNGLMLVQQTFISKAEENNLSVQSAAYWKFLGIEIGISCSHW